MAVSGRKSEDFVQIAVADFYRDGGIALYPQGMGTRSEAVEGCLTAASKGVGGGRGRPDFVGMIERLPNAVLIVENKADADHHVSRAIAGLGTFKMDAIRHAKKYACDGALHYARHFSPRFDVICLGVSGIGAENGIERADYYYCIKGSDSFVRIQSDGMSLLREAELIRAFKSNPELSRHRVNFLGVKSAEFAAVLAGIGFNNQSRAVFFGMLLIALEDRDFCGDIGGNAPKAAWVLDRMKHGVLRRFDNRAPGYDVVYKQIDALVAAINHRLDNAAHYAALLKLMREIWEVRDSLEQSGAADSLGAFYTSFMSKMPGGESDKKDFGIILTPHHVTDMFPLIADVDAEADSVLVDTCCGTAAFLMSVLRYGERRDGVARPADFINRYVIGVENNEVMYLLSCFNMLLKGGDASNIIFGDSFQESLRREIKRRAPTFAFLNPPYSVKRDGAGGLDYARHELRFVMNACELVRPGGAVLALIPTKSVAAADRRVNAVKRELLALHTVAAVLKLSRVTFQEVANVEVCIIVCVAGVPHPAEGEVYLGNWENDGMVFERGVGAADKHGRHDALVRKMVANLRRRREVAGESILAPIAWDDEWVYQSKLTAVVEKRQLTPPSRTNIARHILNYAAARIRAGEMTALDEIRTAAAGVGAPEPRFEVKNLCLWRLDEVFELTKGKRHHVNRAEMDLKEYPEPGCIPYVSASEIEEKQGVNGYIAQNAVGRPTHGGRYLTLNYGGGRLHCFYREGVAYCTDSLNVAHVRGEGDVLNVFVGAYLKEIIMAYKPCFSYNSAPSLRRVRGLKIALPVGAAGKVDWGGVEAYAKAAFVGSFGG